MTISKKTLDRLKQFATDGDSCATGVLHILERLEVLEALLPTPERNAAQPDPVAAPAGGLVERVGAAMERHYVIGDIQGSWDAQARAAICEVAAWLRENETGFNAAYWLELEVVQ
jgi:hypothetical protein